MFTRGSNPAKKDTGAAAPQSTAEDRSAFGFRSSNPSRGGRGGRGGGAAGASGDDRSGFARSNREARGPGAGGQKKDDNAGGFGGFRSNNAARK